MPEANHFACSGAKTVDFYRPGKQIAGKLDQLSYLAAREAISKVYVTMGGNDAG